MIYTIFPTLRLTAENLLTSADKVATFLTSSFSVVEKQHTGINPLIYGLYLVHVKEKVFIMFGKTLT